MKLEEVIQRDDRASQPAATDVPVGTLYYVTDENVTERSNGTTWDDYSDAGGGGGGGGGGLVFLEGHAASNSATLDFTAFLSSSYDDYLIEIVGLIPATDAVNLYMTVSTDGGSTYSNSGYKYGILSITAHSGTTGSQTESATEFNLGGTIENTVGASFVNASIRMFNPGSTTRIKGFLLDTAWTGSDAHYYTWRGIGAWADTNDINAVRFAFSSGNIAEGTIRIYGYAKS